MTFARAVGVIALSALAVTACDDDPTGVQIADLAGFWTATEFTYSDATGDHPGFGIDAIATGGGTITLDVTQTGAFSGELSVPGLTVHPVTGETVTVEIGGTISLLDDETLHIDFDQATEQLGFFADFDADFTLVGNVLTFVNEDTTFDFPDPLELQTLGEARGPVAATLTATFRR